MSGEERPGALVWFSPEEPGEIVTLHAYWGADNGVETATFPTKAEAIEFCWRRWRVPAERVRVKRADRSAS